MSNLVQAVKEVFGPEQGSAFVFRYYEDAFIYAQVMGMPVYLHVDRMANDQRPFHDYRRWKDAAQWVVYPDGGWACIA